MRPEWLEVSSKLQKKLSKIESKLGDRYVEAARDGDLNLLKKLSETHKVPVDVVHKSTPGFTALQLACLRGHLQVVQHLLEHNADLEKENDLGRTAVDYAVIGCHPKVLNTLILNGGELNWKTQVKALNPRQVSFLNRRFLDCFQSIIECKQHNVKEQVLFFPFLILF